MAASPAGRLLLLLLVAALCLVHFADGTEAGEYQKPSADADENADPDAALSEILAMHDLKETGEGEITSATCETPSHGCGARMTAISVPYAARRR